MTTSAGAHESERGRNGGKTGNRTGRANIPRDFGILSIDAEGMDYEVLLGIDLNVWRPRLIVTEDYTPKDAQKDEYLKRNRYHHSGQCAGNAPWTPAN